MRAGGRHISIVLLTESTDPAHAGQALFEADEAAIRAVCGIVRAPRIILGLGARIDSGCHNEN